MRLEAGSNTAYHPGLIGARVNSADPTTIIVAETVSAILGRFRPQLQAIVLTGSMARGEATYIKVPSGWNTLGDCEVVVVFDSYAPLPGPRDVAEVRREIELRLQQRGIACLVGLSPVHPHYLMNLPPQVYGYELRNCGRVLWGDPRVLSLIPEFHARDIRLEDGWRMICNRMIEQLAVAEEGAEAEVAGISHASYGTIKLCLDLATSFLLFCGEYAPTYEVRSARLQRLSEKLLPIDGLTFPLPPFAALVKKVTRWKISPASAILEAEPLLKAKVWDYARQLWRWELLRLTGEADALPDSDLMRRWMRAQPLHRRIRGWASLARKQSGHDTWRQWPHWARLGMTGSPRYWIYAAGSELFFQLPGFVDQSGAAPSPERSLQTWREWLPVRPEQEQGRSISWQQLASEINWNYRKFLMETSS